MLVDLVHIITRDGVRLDGIYQTPVSVPDKRPVEAVLCVHGTGGNFYGSTLFDALAERLLQRGCAVLRINTRGHDLMSNATTTRGGRRLGAAYEVLDDCRHDLAGWLDWLRQRGTSRVGLIGHSSGAVKCLYAQAHEPDASVACVVALSPPRLSYSWFESSDRGVEFRNVYQQAQALQAVGESESLLDVRIPLPFVITAAGYVEKYGPDERYNFLRFLDRITCPVLVTLGEKEIASNMAFRGSAEAIAEVAPAVAVERIADADHFYTGVREALLNCVDRWMQGV